LECVFKVVGRTLGLGLPNTKKRTAPAHHNPKTPPKAPTVHTCDTYYECIRRTMRRTERQYRRALQRHPPQAPAKKPLLRHDSIELHKNRLDRAKKLTK
jgi:hypothetical protein